MQSNPTFVDVNDSQLAYFSYGAGETIVFVHGAVSDHRFWLPQLQRFAGDYRCIGLDQRYFGHSRDQSSRPYSLSTHASDLSAFVDTLGLGSVHVVATSYGAGVALASASAMPDRFASLFLNEPTLASLVTEPASLVQLSAARKDLAAVAAALAAGDEERAVELFCDWTAFPGAFETLPPELKAVFHENAATVRLLFAAPAPTITAADLGTLKMPVTFTTGEKTKPFFHIQTMAAHRSVEHSSLLAIAQAHHAPSFECVDAFNRAVIEHLNGAAATAA